MPASSSDLTKAVEEIVEELDPFEPTDRARIVAAVVELLGIKLP
jgi:hypothetical protein